MNSKKILDLKQQLELGNYRALDDFWKEIDEKGSPFIEDDKETSLVTFIYKGCDETKDVSLSLPFEKDNYFDTKWTDYEFKRLLDTNVWYKTCDIKNDIRFTYYMSVNNFLRDDGKKNWVSDILNKNPLRMKDDDGKEFILTYVSMPKTDKCIWIEEKKDILKGSIDLHRFKSNRLNNERNIWIYTPVGYSNSNEPYNFLVLTDGQDYLDISTVSAKTVLDNLINAKKIPPLVVIFVESTKDRMTELMCSDDFAFFISEEIIPWVKENYNTTDNPEKNIIGGLSLGGLTASFIGLNYSNIFGNVLSQSGSYWYKREDIDDIEKRNWIAKQFKAKEKLNLKFYLTVGILEGKRMYEMHQELKETLMSKGYEVFYEEFKSGHDYLCWGETLAKGLIALIGH